MSSTSSSSQSFNRWWYVNGGKDGGGGAAATTTKKSHVFTRPRAAIDRVVDQAQVTKWQFKVFVNFELQPNEKVSLTGACDQLGNWNPCDSIVLQLSDGE